MDTTNQPTTAITTASTGAVGGDQKFTNRPRLMIYHPSPKGTGCAMRMELHPAHDRTDGSIMISLANQMTIGNRQGPNPTYPRFDWENTITIKLDFSDLCQMLQVLRGETESVGNGRGLYHETAAATTKIVFRHLLEPVSGYSLEVYRTKRGGDEDLRSHLLLSPAEGLGVTEAIAGSMSVICFGIPMVIQHDTTAYKANQKRYRDENAF